MTIQTGRGRPASQLVLGLLLFGLFAMHGLPDAMAGAGPAMASPTATARPHTAPPVSDMAGGCGLDHGGCVAVLRDPAHSLAPAAAVVAGTHVAATPLPVPPVFLSGARAPPGVSLVGLGISRT